MVLRARSLATRHWPFLVLLAVGALLRGLLMAAYRPGVVDYPDSWGYILGADEHLFVPDVRRPAGYSVFLRLLHDVWPSVEFTIVIQHLLGLVVAWIVYMICLRAGTGRWLALIPVVVAALTIDLLYLEHGLLSETLCTAMMFGAVLLVFVALPRARSRRGMVELALAGLLLGAGVTVRISTLFALASIAVLVPLLVRGALGRRVVSAVVFAVPAIAIVLAYMVAQNNTTGFFGLAPGGGWALYARAAPFADCRYFTPPKGTEALCERSNPRDRYGGNFYAWDVNSPGRKLGPPLEAAPLLQKFAIAAIVQEPKAYMRRIATDMWHFVDPYGPGQPVAGGGTPDEMAIDSHYEAGQRLNMSVITPYYGRTEVHRTALLGTFADGQKILRFHGPLMLLSLIATLTGLALGARRERGAILLLSTVGFVIPIVSVLTVIWGWRYAASAQPAMAAAGAIGIAVLVARVRDARAKKPAHSRDASLTPAA